MADEAIYQCFRERMFSRVCSGCNNRDVTSRGAWSAATPEPQITKFSMFTKTLIYRFIRYWNAWKLTPLYYLIWATQWCNSYFVCRISTPPKYQKKHSITSKRGAEKTEVQTYRDPYYMKCCFKNYHIITSNLLNIAVVQYLVSFVIDQRINENDAFSWNLNMCRNVKITLNTWREKTLLKRRVNDSIWRNNTKI